MEMGMRVAPRGWTGRTAYRSVHSAMPVAAVNRKRRRDPCRPAPSTRPQRRRGFTCLVHRLDLTRRAERGQLSVRYGVQVAASGAREQTSDQYSRQGIWRGDGRRRRCPRARRLRRIGLVHGQPAAGGVPPGCAAGAGRSAGAAAAGRGDLGARRQVRLLLRSAEAARRTAGARGQGRDRGSAAEGRRRPTTLPTGR